MNLNIKNKDIDYDTDNDVLYISFGDTSNSYGDEDVDNIVWLKDLTTDTITGLTILDYLKMDNNQDIRLSNLQSSLDMKSINNFVRSQIR